MSKITLEDVDYVADLAQLRLDDESRERLRKEMSDILEYVGKLDELDTSDVEPMTHVVELTNVFREDVVTPSLDRDKALSGAPRTDGEYFLVPRILESE